MQDTADGEEMLTVEIWRGRDDGALRSYQVPRRASQTVLDVVTWVQRHAEPALAYRFACRVGMCGSCAMQVNGKPRWTCRTHVSRVAKDGHLRIEPLANLPKIKDLATDMAPFFEKWPAAGTSRHAPGTSRWPRSRPKARPGKRRMPGSNASIAQSATPPAMWSGGTKAISARRR